MKTITRSLFFLLLCFFIAPPSHAGEMLSSSDVGSFLDSMNDVQVLTEKMEKEGKTDVLKEHMRAGFGKDFSPYQKGVGALKTKFPADYTSLNNIVKDHGFSSAENWAGVGDSIIEAYIGTKMKSQGIGEKMAVAKAQMTPEIMASMPAETRAQMEHSFMMLEHFQSVPKSNMEALGPHMDRIQSMMEQATPQ